MESRKHEDTARQIAKREGTGYNRGQGPDINTSRRAIEVETESTIKDGLRQLQGFRKPVYIAGTDQQTTEKALELTKRTTVGVMNKRGDILKRSTRKQP
jgi:hypothetical protein